MKRLETYIDNLRIEDDDKDKIVVEHRSKNPKRDYLFVNKVQGKHIPTKPSETIKMFDKLVYKVKNSLPVDSKTLVIGFAETATAIGNYVANHYTGCKYYLQTTREHIDDMEPIIEFKEEHSHAVEQTLFSKFNISELDINTVLFVEDEISTGKTILNCIDKIKNIFGSKKIQYAVASICNWQNDKNIEIFKSNNIIRIRLISGQLKDEKMKMNVNPDSILDTSDEWLNTKDEKINTNTISAKSEQMPIERVGYIPNNLKNYIRMTTSLVENTIGSSKEQSLLVLGTEEFMYIPISVALQLECKGYNVVTHSTSRSSIDVLNIDNCTEGIINKTLLPSAYDENRKTYVYNLKHYDKVVILTDSSSRTNVKFKQALTRKLTSLGISNDNIYFIELQS